MIEPESGTVVPDMGTDLMAKMRQRAKGKVRVGGPKCAVCSLPAEILAAVRTLRAEGFAVSVIAATLQEDGISVKANALGRHFREDEDGR